MLGWPYNPWDDLHLSNFKIFKNDYGNSKKQKFRPIENTLLYREWIYEKW